MKRSTGKPIYIPQHIERIPLMKLERIVRLRFNVHPHNLEPRTVISHRSPASPAEQIEQPGLGLALAVV